MGAVCFCATQAQASLVLCGELYTLLGQDEVKTTRKQIEIAHNRCCVELRRRRSLSLSCSLVCVAFYLELERTFYVL